MSVSAPHFLLYAHATGNTLVGAAANSHDEVELEMGGKWRFVLQTPEGETLLDAEDEEDGDSRERLELLAIVRGLEALDQPSQVTLVTQSQAISRGLREGLQQWRENDWQWERFGSLTPIKNRDLWQRVDQAMGFHQVKCRLVSGGGSDDLNMPPPSPAFNHAAHENAAPTMPPPRRVRNRQVRFDPGTASVATPSPPAKTSPRRTRPRPTPAPTSFWERAVGGVQQLFRR